MRTLVVALVLIVIFLPLIGTYIGAAMMMVRERRKRVPTSVRCNCPNCGSQAFKLPDGGTAAVCGYQAGAGTVEQPCPWKFISCLSG